MKLLGIFLLLGSTVGLLYKTEKEKLHRARRTEEALRLLLTLEGGVGYLASPLSELLAEYATAHPQSLLIMLPEELSEPKAFLKPGSDAASRALSMLFSALGETNRDEVGNLFAYCRAELISARKKEEKERENGLRVRIPTILALTLLLVILIY